MHSCGTTRIGALSKKRPLISRTIMRACLITARYPSFPTKQIAVLERPREPIPHKSQRHIHTNQRLS